MKNLFLALKLYSEAALCSFELKLWNSLLNIAYHLLGFLKPLCVDFLMGLKHLWKCTIGIKQIKNIFSVNMYPCYTWHFKCDLNLESVEMWMQRWKYLKHLL